VRFAQKLWEEFVFEVLLGLDLSRQPNARLTATPKRCPEKAGSVLRTSSKFRGRRWLCLAISCGGFSAILRVERNDS